MATLQDLQALSQGQSLVPVSNNTQTIVVQNQNNGGGCLPCNDDVCEVDATQAVTLDAGRFTRTTGKLRLTYDTTGAEDPTLEQNIVLFSDFSAGDSVNFPRLAGLILPVYGEGASDNVKSGIVGSVTIGLPTLTWVSGPQFSPNDVGSVIFADTTIIPPNTTIIAFVSPTVVTMSANATATNAAVDIVLIGDGALLTPNGATINGNPGAAVIFELNNVLSGGSIVASIEHQYNSATSPASAGIEITGFHLPIDPRNAAITTISLSPLCDSCSTSGVGTFVTNKYTVGHGVTWRDGIVISIPGSEEGSAGTIDICYGAIALPNAQFDTWAHQAA